MGKLTPSQPFNIGQNNSSMKQTQDDHHTIIISAALRESGKNI
jgi:hypothetical protein